MFDLSKFIDYSTYIKVAVLAWLVLTLFLALVLLFLRPNKAEQTESGLKPQRNLVDCFLFEESIEDSRFRLDIKNPGPFNVIKLTVDFSIISFNTKEPLINPC